MSDVPNLTSTIGDAPSAYLALVTRPLVYSIQQGKINQSCIQISRGSFVPDSTEMIRVSRIVDMPAGILFF